MKISLLVLPFRNWSSSTQDDFLCDGITEELIYTLTRLDHLQVASRTSSFFFKDKDLQPRQIGEQLGISHMLEGSIRRYDEKIRINIHLTDVDTGFTVWSESFNRPYQDLLSLQDDIATFVAQKFSEQQTPAPSIQSELVPNNDVHAYELYLQGLYHYNQYTMDEMEKAVACCKQALVRQPDFALAYALIASCSVALGGYIHPRYYQIAKKTAFKAIQLNAALIEPHLSIAMVKAFYDYDWPGAMASIQQALQLDIRSAEALRMKGIMEIIMGQGEKSIYSHEMATKYDPMNTLFINSQGWALDYSGRFEAARREYLRTLDIDPNFRPAMESLGFSFMYEGKWEEAENWLLRYQTAVGHRLKGWFGLGYLYGKMQLVDKAYAVLDIHNQRQVEDPQENLSLNYALVYLGLGDKKKALSFLRQAVDSHHIWTIARLGIDPIFRELHSEEQYWQLMDRLKLTPYYREGKTLEIGENSPLLVIQSDTKEKLEVLLSELLYIEAQGNYTKFVYLDGLDIRERLLRIPLSAVKDKIDAENIIHCHRSYLANLNFFNSLSGSSRQLNLLCKQTATKLPISRNKEAFVKKSLAEFGE